MSLHSNDSKREEYHRYLEKSGVIEYFSHVLVDLYLTPERPLDPNEFIREQLSKFFPDDTDDLRKQIIHHDEMLMERENMLHELQQEQYEIRLALQAKGVQVDQLHLDLDDDLEEEEEEEVQDLGDFTFENGNIPVFKYHDGGPEEEQKQQQEQQQEQPSQISNTTDNISTNTEDKVESDGAVNVDGGQSQKHTTTIPNLDDSIDVSGGDNDTMITTKPQ